jgi:hypothetical protein
VDPTVDVSLIDGSIDGAVGGKKPETDAEFTVAVSTLPNAPTTTRICKLQTSNVGTYVEVVALEILVQAIPSGDFCH